MLYFHSALCFSMRFVFLFIFVFSLIEFMSFCWSLTQFSNNWFISFFCIFIWSYGQRNIQIRQSLILISLKMNKVVPKWPPNNLKVRFFNYFEKFWVCLWGVFLFFFNILVLCGHSYQDVPNLYIWTNSATYLFCISHGGPSSHNFLSWTKTHWTCTQ